MVSGYKKLNPRMILGIIIAISVALRLLAAAYLGNEVVPLPGTFDQVWYHDLALRVAAGAGFSFDHPAWPLTKAYAPTAHWSFLYTLYLSAVYTIFGPNPLAARLIQAAAVGVVQPLLAYMIGREVFDQRVGLFAAGFTAVYIYFIYYSATLMTEPFYICALMLALLLLLLLAHAEDTTWPLVAALGVTLGMAVLLRQLVLLLVPFLFLWYWWISYRRFHKVPLAETAAAGLIILGMIAPFTFYNSNRFDRFVLLNTNAGYALFWSNHPIYGTQFEGILPPEKGSYQDLIPLELHELDEAALDQALLRRGLQFMIDDPGRIFLLSLSRVPVYFQFWPSPSSGMISNISRVASFALFLPLMSFGVFWAIWDTDTRRKAGSNALLLLIFIIAYALIHLLSWSLIRYRLPVDAVLLVFAGLGAAVLWKWLGNRRGEPTQQAGISSEAV